MENIRQACIFDHQKDQDLYWKYMTNFADMCADKNVPLFNEACSNNVLSLVGIPQAEVEKCMKNSIENNGLIERDFAMFQEKKIYKTPEITLNGVKYRGSLLGKYVFSAICTGFIDDDEICNTPKPEELNARNSDGGLSIGALFLIIIIIVLAMLVVLICYKRIVNKSLEASLNEKIQTQTIHSLGQYQVFKDDTTGRKSVDVTKL